MPQVVASIILYCSICPIMMLGVDRHSSPESEMGNPQIAFHAVSQKDSIVSPSSWHYRTRTWAFTYNTVVRFDDRFGLQNPGAAAGFQLWKDFPCLADSEGWVSFALSAGIVYAYHFVYTSWEFSGGVKARIFHSPMYFAIGPAYLTQPNIEYGHGKDVWERISGKVFWKNLYVVATISLESAGFIFGVRTRFALDPAIIRYDSYHGPFHDVLSWKEAWFDSFSIVIGIKF